MVLPTLVVAKLELLFSYAKTHPKIGGFLPYHMMDRPSFNRGTCPRCHPVPAGKCDSNYWGAESMPLVLSKLREIGRFIVNAAAEAPSSVVNFA